MPNNWVYIVLLLVISIILIMRKNADPKHKKTYSIIVCMILITFSGFRCKVGTDYLGYTQMFDLIVKRGRYYSIEWGYYWIVKLCNYIGGTQQLVFLLFSSVTMIFIYKYIEHFSQNVELSWLLFICIGPYFLSTFNGVRQWVAISVFAYSIKYIDEANLKKYLIINCCAGMIHYSSFVLLPFYFILKRKSLGVTKIILVYVLFVVLNYIGIISRIALVLHATSYLAGSDSLNLGVTYILFFVLAVGCWIYFKMQRKQSYLETSIFENMNLMSGLFVFLAITTTTISNMLFTRFNQYFFIGYIILVPAVVKKTRRFRPIAEVLTCFLAIIYYLILTNTASDLTPYKTNFRIFS